MQGLQLSANLLGVPQIVKLAGKLCVAAPGANWPGILAGPCVAAVRRSSLGLLEMQFAVLLTLLGPDSGGARHFSMGWPGWLCFYFGVAMSH